MDALESASESLQPETTEQGDLPFEQALERLEQVVDRLEQGDLELEVALASFEQGVGLARHCAARLQAAERRIELLVHEGDTWVARPFDESGPAEADENEREEASDRSPVESAEEG